MINYAFRMEHDAHVTATLTYAHAQIWEASYRCSNIESDIRKVQGLLKRSKWTTTIARKQAELDTLHAQLRVAHQDYEFWTGIRRACGWNVWA